jgi:hypothetical protein
MNARIIEYMNAWMYLYIISKNKYMLKEWQKASNQTYKLYGNTEVCMRGVQEHSIKSIGYGKVRIWEI